MAVKKKREYRGGHPSDFRTWEFAYVLHELLDLPLDKLKPTGSSEPYTGVKIIKTIFKSIADALRRGEEVKIYKFGTFTTIPRKKCNFSKSILAVAKDGTILARGPHKPKALGKRVKFKPAPFLQAVLDLDHPERAQAVPKRLIERWQRNADQ